RRWAWRARRLAARCGEHLLAEELPDRVRRIGVLAAGGLRRSPAVCASRRYATTQAIRLGGQLVSKLAPRLARPACLVLHLRRLAARGPFLQIAMLVALYLLTVSTIRGFGAWPSL